MAQQGWQTVTIASAPKAKINAFLSAAEEEADALVVFLNGLMLPARGWQAVLDGVTDRERFSTRRLHALAYDRFGQGESDPDPEGSHTADVVVRQLRELLEQVALPAFFPGRSSIDECPIILVSNSIGGATTRLYAVAYPLARIEAVLFLDSIIASTDFVSIFSPAIEPEEERKDLAKAREVVRRIFHPSVPNAEGFDRTTLAGLLPLDDGPPLPSKPFVTVVGHDFDVFARDSEEKLGTPVAITDKYMNRRWNEYNVGLTKLTTPDRARGPIIAQGADHFIQRARPDLVVDELAQLCARASLASPSHS